MAQIKNITAREILNSKGFPTVEVSVVLDNGLTSTSSCPTGTSVSKYEAKELRDNDEQRYHGHGVLKAVNNVMTVIAPKIIGMDPTQQVQIDKVLMELDGTPDKSNLGVNAVLPVSQAVAKAGAKSLNMPLYSYIRHFVHTQNNVFKIPAPEFNIINGGKHAENNLDFQEFIIIPATSMTYSQALNMAVTVYQSLKVTLSDKGVSVLIGDEGGFGPSFSTNRDALVMLNEAVNAANFRLNYDIFFGLDVSANNFYDSGKYNIKDKGNGVSSKDLGIVYEGLAEEFGLLYLEDPMAEDDWEGWENLNSLINKKTMIVGDDLTATNFERLQTAISKKAIGGIIIKPNQIGTILETIAVAEVAKQAGLKIIASHRSGDTNDDFMADFAVGIGADYVKFGAPARGERVAKYNRLLEIEAEIRSL